MHALYTACLCGPFVYILAFYPYWRLLEAAAVGLVTGVLRFRFRVNKYLLWAPVALVHMIVLTPRVEETGLTVTF